MAKYSVSKLNGKGQPDFSGTRTIEDTESRMFIQLAKEIVKGAPGFYIYQAANRSGLKVRYLIKNPDGKGFAVKNDKGQIVEKFTVSGPDFQEPKTPKAPKTSAPRVPKAAPRPTMPKTEPPKPAPYYYTAEHDNEPWKRSRDSRRFRTIREMYINAYQVASKDHGVVCVMFKNDDFMNPPRSVHYSPWYDCVTLGTYGRNSHDYRLYADGRLKLLTKDDIKKR